MKPPDMIIYTAEVKNERAFKQIIAMREGELMAMQKVSEVIKQVLADPTVERPINAAENGTNPACSSWSREAAHSRQMELADLRMPKG